MHSDRRTTFVTFRHKMHAIQTEEMIKHYTYTNKTLPIMCEEYIEPLPMNERNAWAGSLQDMHICRISPQYMYTLCKVHNAALLDVIHIDEMDYTQVLNISYHGYIRPGEYMSTDNARKYFEYLT